MIIPILSIFLYFLKSKYSSTIKVQPCYPLQSFCWVLCCHSEGRGICFFSALTNRFFTIVQNDKKKQKVFPLLSGLGMGYIAIQSKTLRPIPSTFPISITLYQTFHLLSPTVHRLCQCIPMLPLY